MFTASFALHFHLHRFSSRYLLFILHNTLPQFFSSFFKLRPLPSSNPHTLTPPTPHTTFLSRDEMDVNALLKALQTTLRFEQEMASRFGAPTPAPAPPVRRDSGRESDHAFPYSSGVQREPETEVRNFSPTLHNYLLSFLVTLALVQYFN